MSTATPAGGESVERDSRLLAETLSAAAETGQMSVEPPDVQRAHRREAIKRVLAVSQKPDDLLIRQGIVTTATPWSAVYDAFSQSTDKAAYLRNILGTLQLTDRQIADLERFCDAGAAAVLCSFMAEHYPLKDVEGRFGSWGGKSEQVLEILTASAIRFLESLTVKASPEKSAMSILLDEYVRRERMGNLPHHLQRAFLIRFASEETYPLEALVKHLQYQANQKVQLPDERLVELAHEMTTKGRLKMENGVLACIFLQMMNCPNISTETLLKVMCLHPQLKRMMLPDWRNAELREAAISKQTDLA